MSFDFGSVDFDASDIDFEAADVASDIDVDPGSADYGAETLADSSDQVGDFAGDPDFVDATDSPPLQESSTDLGGYQDEASQLADGNGIPQPSAIDSLKDQAGSLADKAKDAASGAFDKIKAEASSTLTKLESQFSAKNIEAFATKTAKNLVASAENLVINTAKNVAVQSLSRVVGPAVASTLTNSVTRSLTGPTTKSAGAVNKATDPTAGGAFVETSPGVFTAKEDIPPADDPNAPLVEIPPPGSDVATTAKSVSKDTDPTAGGEFVETSPGVFVAKEDIPPADDPNAPLVAIPPPASAVDKSAANVGYVTGQDAENGTYYVKNEATGEIVASGLSQQQATLRAQDQTFIDAGDVPAATNAGSTAVNYLAPGAIPDPNLATLPASTDPAAIANAAAAAAAAAVNNAANAALAEAAARTSALIAQAQRQQTIRAQRQNQAQAGDWRVRLRLGPTSNYLYNAPDCGQVLWPLRNTDGVIFPYTPSIDTSYKANYSAYDLTHSNYRGYFYQNSYVDAINIKATFTAQDTTEANYLLAVIHFFRSVTKMFYGQDAERGSPPPLTYLSGLGDFQFNEHPCLVSQFNYNLPADVNYIRAQSVLVNGTNLTSARSRQTVLGNPLSYAIQRLSTLGQGIQPGAIDAPFAAQGSLGAKNPTYVPTKMDISLTLLPIQSRSQVSQLFSLKGFANGNLLKGGFW
jgi:uncharacterized protein YjbJ (UPF0337 family)